MPDVSPGMPGSPGGAGPSSAPPAGPPPQATGPTPASTPAPNRGHEAVALALLGGTVQLLQTLVLARLPVGSDAARDVREAINKMAKHVPPGAMSQGVMSAGQQKMMMDQRQMQPQIAAMRAAQTPGGGGGAPSPAAPPMAA
jgi:hypothetical protein